MLLIIKMPHPYYIAIQYIKQKYIQTVRRIAKDQQVILGKLLSKDP